MCTFVHICANVHICAYLHIRDVTNKHFDVDVSVYCCKVPCFGSMKSCFWPAHNLNKNLRMGAHAESSPTVVLQQFGVHTCLPNQTTRKGKVKPVSQQ